MKLNDKQKRAVRVTIGGIGLVLLLIGTMTDLYSGTTGVLMAIFVWLVVIPGLSIFGLTSHKKSKEKKQG